MVFESVDLCAPLCAFVVKAFSGPCLSTGIQSQRPKLERWNFASASPDVLIHIPTEDIQRYVPAKDHRVVERLEVVTRA